MNRTKTKLVIISALFVIFIVVPGVIFLTLNLESTEELLDSPESIIYQGYNLTLETYLWRDFMPLAEPGGSSLMASIKIVAQNSSEFPSSIEATKMWVFNNDTIWETRLINQFDNPIEENKLIKIAYGGPKWETGIYVDVVVKLSTSEGKLYLRSTNQYIHKIN